MSNVHPATRQLVTLFDVRRLHPNTSIGPNADLVALGYPLLEPVAQPEPGEGQIVRKGDPEEYEPGKWRETWIIEDAPPAPVPQVVSRFQARAALHLAGLLDQVEALMQDPDTDMIARLAWQDAQEFKRQSPTVLAMAQALELTDAQLDELFITASGVEA